MAITTKDRCDRRAGPTAGTATATGCIEIRRGFL